MEWFSYILEHTECPWNWGAISANPNITWDIVREHPECPWDWGALSSNPNITWNNVCAQSKSRGILRR